MAQLLVRMCAKRWRGDIDITVCVKQHYETFFTTMGMRQRHTDHLVHVFQEDTATALEGASINAPIWCFCQS